MVNITIEIDNKTFSKWTETENGKSMAGVDGFIEQMIKEDVLTAVNMAQDIVKERFCEEAEKNGELSAYIKAEVDAAIREAVDGEIRKQLDGRHESDFSSAFREIIYESKQHIIDEAVNRATKELVRRGVKRLIEKTASEALGYMEGETKDD